MKYFNNKYRNNYFEMHRSLRIDYKPTIVYLTYFYDFDKFMKFQIERSLKILRYNIVKLWVMTCGFLVSGDV